MPRDQSGTMTELQFAALVEAIANDAERHDELLDLLREEQALYRDRSATTIARMRGWVLLALERAGVSDAALAFVLEELDVGTDPYLVAAAARALRSYPRPGATLVPFVLGALANIRYRDEPLSFAAYGAYAVSATGTSAVRELLATLAWLGPHAKGAVPQLEALLGPGGLPPKLRSDVRRALQAIRDAGHPADEAGAVSCCGAQAPPPTCCGSAAGIELGPAGGSRRRQDQLQGVLPRPALDRRVLLHALRQSAEMLAHHRQARAGAAAAGGRSVSPTGSARQRSPTIRPSISRRGFAPMGRIAASGWTLTIGCFGRSAETTPCGITSASGSTTSGRW